MATLLVFIASCSALLHMLPHCVVPMIMSENNVVANLPQMLGVAVSVFQQM